MFNINYYQNMYTHLIISGGGVKATSIIGVLEVLYEKNLLDLKGMIGSSAGGLICFLLNIGYTYQEMKEILFSLDFGQYRDIDFSRVLEKWGLDTGLKIMKLIGSVAKQKDISPDITFKELYDKTQQELTLTGSELTKNEAIYFNYHNFPDMKVLDALRITISFPVVFYPIPDKGEGTGCDQYIVCDSAGRAMASCGRYNIQCTGNSRLFFHSGRRGSYDSPGNKPGCLEQPAG